MANSSGKYNMWVTHNEPGPKGPPRYWPKPVEQEQAEAQMSREGGRFQCPGCKKTYGVKLAGVYGTPSPLREATHYCKWCAERLGVRRS